MKILYFDCFSGISGDMTLGALMDLGVPAGDIIRELKKLNLDGWEIAPRRVSKNGIDCVYAGVAANERFDDNGGHDHDHHDHHGHHHRNFADIARIIDASGITDAAKQTAKGIFRVLAVAEGAVHGVPADQVGFHEVGALDSIIDIVGTAVALDMLRPERIVSSPVSDGRGFTRCQHGVIPVPVPAVAEIFSAHNIECRQADCGEELVTPTGAAILAYLCEGFGAAPAMRLLKTGYGAGLRDNAFPNCLRLCLGEAADAGADRARPPENGTITVIETSIDDCAPETVAYAAERLLAAGANDVFTTPIVMKKGRAAVKLSVLCAAENAEAMCGIIFDETTSIGLRIREERRVVLPRSAVERQTEYGTITGKMTVHDGRRNAKPEFESMKSAAAAASVPLREISRAFFAAGAEKQSSKEE